MIKIILKENRRLLNEITLDQAASTLNSKATRKLIYKYALQSAVAKKRAPPLEPSEAEIDIRVSKLGLVLWNSIPNDITDAQKALSYLWMKRFILSSYNLYLTSFLNPRAFVPYQHDIENFFHLQHLIEPPEKRDLNNIHSGRELENLVHDLLEQERERERLEAEERVRQRRDRNINAVDNYDNIDGLEFLGSGDGFKVFIPETFEAACEIGAQGWCTTRSRNMFNRYSSEDNPLFIFINEEDPSRKYQFNYGADNGVGQFMDKDNYPVPNNIKLRLHEILLSLNLQERYPIIGSLDYGNEEDDYNSGEGEPY